MNVKLLKHSLKRGLLYGCAASGAGVLLTCYFKVFFSGSYSFSAASFFHQLSDLVFFLGMVYPFLFMVIGFATSFFAEIAYGGTRKNSLQYMITSIAICAVFSLLVSFLSREAGAIFGSGDRITPQILCLCLNILLLVLALGLLGGFAVAKFGKYAYYVVSFLVFGAIGGYTFFTTLSSSGKRGFVWTSLSETFAAQAPLTAILLGLLTGVFILVSRGVSKMEVKA